MQHWRHASGARFRPSPQAPNCREPGIDCHLSTRLDMYTINTYAVRLVSYLQLTVTDKAGPHRAGFALSQIGRLKEVARGTSRSRHWRNWPLRTRQCALIILKRRS